MKHTILLLILLATFLLSLAPSAHAQDPKTLTLQMETLLKPLRPSDRKPLVETYVALMTSSDWATSEKDSIAAALQGLQDLHLPLTPDIRSFILCVNSFYLRGEHQNLRVWLQPLQRLLASPERKRVEVKTYLAATLPAAREQLLWDGNSHCWQIDGQLEWHPGTPLRLTFTQARLTCSTRKDTIAINSTSGTYLIGASEINGLGGTVTWHNGEAPVTADLSRYRISLNLSGYTADSVLLHHEDKFGRPLRGQLKDNALKSPRTPATPYPEFTSYDHDITLPGILPHITFRGGIAYQGKKFLGLGTPRTPALFTIRPNDTIRMDIRARHFDFDSLRVVAGQAAIEIDLDSGTISHSNITFSYAIPQRAATLKRISEQSLQAPFKDTYHKILLGVEEIHWPIDSAHIDMRMSSRTGLFKATIESLNFFSDQIYDDLQGLDETNPLNALLKCSRALGETTFTLGDYSAYLRKPVDQLRRQIVLLSYNDFVDYDEPTDQVTLKQRLLDYTKARVGKQDYDNIRFLATPDKSRLVARLDTRNRTLRITGVTRFLISAAHNIYVEPFDQQLTMMKNRDMLFNGKLNAGVFNMFGRQLFFSYDKYAIHMPQVDSAAMYMAAREGQAHGKRINSLIREIQGDILIDSPDNKSGKNARSGYPVFNSTKESYVYFDEPSIQGGQYHRDSFYYCIAPYTIRGINNPDGIRYAFDGTLHSTILDPIRDTLRLLEDNALGLQYQTPADGLALYGKGRLTSRLTLNRSGLTASGTVDLNGTRFRSDTILLLPARMDARTDSLDIRSLRGLRPSASGRLLALRYRPSDGLLRATSTSDPFRLYAGRVTHRGTLLVSDRALDASGTLSLEGATLQSILFHLRDTLLETPSTALNFTSVLNKDIRINTSDVAATIDLAANKGTFTNNAKDNRVDFTSSRYTCSFIHATWYMRDAYLNIGIEDPALLRQIASTPDPARLPAAARNTFTSTNPAFDSLRFIVPLARYDLKQGDIQCQYIPHIDLANGRFYPSRGRLSIAPDGTIDTLRDGRLLCDLADTSCTLTRVTLALSGRNAFTGSGDYLYVSEEKTKTPVHFHQISVDTSRLIYAKAELKEQHPLALNAAFRFKGTLTLHSLQPRLRFTGSARMTLADTTLRHSWLAIDTPLDPRHIAIPVSVENHNDTRQRIHNGIYLHTDRTFRPYAILLGTRRFYKDDLLIGGHGLLQWNPALRQYIISDTAATPLYRFRHDPETSAISATGPIHLPLQIPGAHLKTAGEIAFNLRDNQLRLTDLLATLDFTLLPKLQITLLRDLGGTTTPKTIRLTTPLRLKIHALHDPAVAPAVDKRLAASSNNLPDSLRRLFAFDSLTLAWNPKTHSYVASGQARLLALHGKPLDKTLHLRLEILRARAGNQLFLHLSDGDLWYYFEFSDQSLYTLSSNEEYNEILRTEKPEKKTIRSDQNTTLYTITLCPPSKKDRFLQRVK